MQDSETDIQLHFLKWAPFMQYVKIYCKFVLQILQLTLYYILLICSINCYNFVWSRRLLTWLFIYSYPTKPSSGKVIQIKLLTNMEGGHHPPHISYVLPSSDRLHVTFNRSRSWAKLAVLNVSLWSTYTGFLGTSLVCSIVLPFHWIVTQEMWQRIHRAILPRCRCWYETFGVRVIHASSYLTDSC